jgi:hypothetical protein
VYMPTETWTARECRQRPTEDALNPTCRCVHIHGTL